MDEIPGIYHRSPQDIAEPGLNKWPQAIDLPPDALDVVHKAITGLLTNLGGYFGLVPCSSPAEHDLNLEIERVDHDIGRMCSVMLALKQDLSQRVAALSKRRNTITPFGRLPPELMGLIFAQAILERDRSIPDIAELRKMAMVSTGWWRIVQTYPSLWTVVSDEPGENASLKLRKSGNLPLTIIAHKPYELTFLEQAIAHSVRWKSASFRPCTTKQLDLIRESLRTSMPYLETLTVDCGAAIEDPAPLEIHRGPALVHVSVDGMTLHLTAPGLEKLQYLTLGYTGDGSMLKTLDALAYCVSLKFLRVNSLLDESIEVGEGMPESRVSNLGPPLRLPSLQSLILHDTLGPCIAVFLERLYTDVLSQLHIKVHYGSDERQILPHLIRTNGKLSLLSIALTNTTLHHVKLSITSDYYLCIMGGLAEGDGAEEEEGAEEEGVGNPIRISLKHPGVSHYLETALDYQEFAARLPPVSLHLDEGRFEISLGFLHKMPTIHSITVRTTGATIPERLFQYISEPARSADEDLVWACPMLAEVRIKGMVRDDDWEKLLPVISRSLRARAQAARSEPLPRIKIMKEVQKTEGEYGFECVVVT